MIVPTHTGEAIRIRPRQADPIHDTPRPIGEIIAELLDRYSDTLTTADQLPDTAREVGR